MTFLAPKCPIPPTVPEDGVKEHVPLPIEIPPTKLCSVDAEIITLSCHSFLKVYVISVTYGRNSSSGKELCDGEKKDEKSLGSGTCYSDEYNQQLRREISLECHGKFNCSFNVPTLPLTEDCDTLKREIRVEYICGKCTFLIQKCLNIIFPLLVECTQWFQYINDPDCIKKSLMNNKWKSEDELASLADGKIKDLLVKNLSWFYNGNIHTSIDLTRREPSGEKGSLCGMAALYKAALQTILSEFQLKLMSYDDVKVEIGKYINLSPSLARKQIDADFLIEFHQGELYIHVL